ncbi:MAG: hypothetical protein HC915_16645 [Anaerolineae bacterium]|nr:hypothetical protein [Anaerolineae bacterium]
MLALAGLVGLCGFFFWRLLTPVDADQIVIAPGGDFAGQFYNFSVYQANRFAQGDRIPLWNPYNFGGSPFLADPQWAVAYPMRWLSLALWSENWDYRALQWEFMLHTLLASWTMYALGRVLSGQVLGGVVSAIVFAYGPYLQGFPVQQLSIFYSSTWLPLAILGIHWGSRAVADWRGYLIGGVGMALVSWGASTDCGL